MNNKNINNFQIFKEYLKKYKKMNINIHNNILFYNYCGERQSLKNSYNILIKNCNTDIDYIQTYAILKSSYYLEDNTPDAYVQYRINELMKYLLKNDTVKKIYII